MEAALKIFVDRRQLQATIKREVTEDKEWDHDRDRALPDKRQPILGKRRCGYGHVGDRTQLRCINTQAGRPPRNPSTCKEEVVCPFFTTREIKAQSDESTEIQHDDRDVDESKVSFLSRWDPHLDFGRANRRLSFTAGYDDARSNGVRVGVRPVDRGGCHDSNRHGGQLTPRVRNGVVTENVRWKRRNLGRRSSDVPACRTAEDQNV